MEREISIRNESGVSLPLARYRAFLLRACAILGEEGASLGVLFTTDDGIREYNKRYRNKDAPTDVLSFEYDDDDAYLGDIVISYEWVQRETRPRLRTRETKLLLIHALLHLKGEEHTYDEASLTKVWAKMEQLLKRIEDATQ